MMMNDDTGQRSFFCITEGSVIQRTSSKVSSKVIGLAGLIAYPSIYSRLTRGKNCVKAVGAT